MPKMQFSYTYFNVPQFFFYFYTSNIYEKSCGALCISFAKFHNFCGYLFQIFSSFSTFLAFFTVFCICACAEYCKISNV